MSGGAGAPEPGVDTAADAADGGAPDGASGERWRRRCEGLLGVPATEGNRIEILRNGEEIFPAMLDAIAASEHTVDLLTYVYWSGDIGRRFADALAGRARAGVRVRILLDGLGARPLQSGDVVDELRDAGCDVRWFRPLDDVIEVNHRTHRKVMVCDEQTSFAGGVGIADEWMGDGRSEGNWRDTHVRLDGPATDGLRAAFLDNWIETGRPLFDDADRFPDQQRIDGGVTVQVIRGAAEIGVNSIAALLRALVASAERTIDVTTAYFQPDETIMSLLLDARQRGVRVRLLLPGPHHDKRIVQLASEDCFGVLLDHGIEIHRYQPSMLHAKIMIFDGEVATVGSANLNTRSAQHDEEVDLVLFDRPKVAELTAHFDEDLAYAERLDADAWNGDRSLPERLAQAAASQLSRWF